MSSHKTLIGGTSRTLSGGGCIVNGTSYKISGGNTLINGTSKKIEFGAAKTWYFNEDIYYQYIYELPNNTETKEFTADFYTPYISDFFGKGNQFKYLQFQYKRGSKYHTRIIYVMANYLASAIVYQREAGLWSAYGDNARTITFDESPTGDLLYFLQHAATPVY